uniref:Beta-defensin-like domain-containing protein n=1 Tax=Terrapene triunguis TaxID=2587831 RepID=A0A674I7R3_9SAUR
SVLGPVLFKILTGDLEKGTLFLCAGFTQFINSPAACRRARGTCFRFCVGRYRLIGTCEYGKQRGRTKVYFPEEHLGDVSPLNHCATPMRSKH